MEAKSGMIRNLSKRDTRGFVLGRSGDGTLIGNGGGGRKTWNERGWRGGYF